QNEISEMKTRLDEKEIEILDYQDKLLDMDNKSKQLLSKTVEEYEKKLHEMEMQSERIKNHYFFSVAISLKLDSNLNKSVDLNVLYDQCKLENIPIENWYN